MGSGKVRCCHRRSSYRSSYHVLSVHWSIVIAVQLGTDPPYRFRLKSGHIETKSLQVETGVHTEPPPAASSGKGRVGEAVTSAVSLTLVSELVLVSVADTASLLAELVSVGLIVLRVKNDDDGVGS